MPIISLIKVLILNISSWLNKKLFDMTGIAVLKNLVNTSSNPNNCPPNLDFLSEVDIVDECTKKIKKH